jgi:hypothetical protein
MQVTLKDNAQVARSLSDLVPLIRVELKLAEEAAQAAAWPHWLKVGAYLLEAKVSFGGDKQREFVPWTRRTFKISDDQRNRWMRGAANATPDMEKPGGRVSPLESYLKGTGYEKGSPSRSWHDPVKKIVSTVNLKALQQDELDRKEERELQRKLANKLIDIGYKVLAAELHPDKKGGSAEAMSRLNEVRARLKQYA